MREKVRAPKKVQCDEYSRLFIESNTTVKKENQVHKQGLWRKHQSTIHYQGPKFIFGFGSTCATRCKFLSGLVYNTEHVSNTRQICLKDVLSFELSPVPYSLANADGTLRKEGKSVLCSILEKDVNVIQ